MADQKVRDINVGNINDSSKKNGDISTNRKASASKSQTFSSHNPVKSSDLLTNRLSSLKSQRKSQKEQSIKSPGTKCNPYNVSSGRKNRISTSPRHVIATTRQKLKSSIESTRNNAPKITDVSEKITKAKNTLSSRTIAQVAKIRESLINNEQNPKNEAGDFESSGDDIFKKGTSTKNESELSKVERLEKDIGSIASKLKREIKKTDLRGKIPTNSEGNRGSSNLGHIKHQSPSLLSRNGNVFDRLYNLSKKPNNTKNTENSEKERNISIKNVSKQKKMRKNENVTLMSQTKKNLKRNNNLGVNFSTPTSSNKSTPILERFNRDGTEKQQNHAAKVTSRSTSNKYTPSYLKTRLGYIPESYQLLSSEKKSPVLRAKSVYSRLYAYSEDKSRRRSEELLQNVKLKSGGKKKMMSPARKINFDLSFCAEKGKEPKPWKKGISKNKPLRVNNSDIFDARNDMHYTKNMNESKNLEVRSLYFTLMTLIIN